MTSPSAPRLSDEAIPSVRWVIIGLLSLGFTIAGFAIACTELIGARATSVDTALFFAVLSLSGFGLATANYWALTQTLIPASAMGRVSGIQNYACSVAGIVAPILSGWLLQQTGSYDAPMMAILVVLVVGVLCYLFMIREEYAPQGQRSRGVSRETGLPRRGCRPLVAA
jgi:MFS family permease